MYGKQLKPLFYLSDYTNLNHGSFGAVPKEIVAKQFEYTLEQEKHPDIWFRQGYYEHINRSRNTLADLLNADIDDIVLVENASAAINCVLRSNTLKKGDKVLVLQTSYNMVLETLLWLSNTIDIEIIKVDLIFPISDFNHIIEQVEKTILLHDKNSIKLAIFSHVSSMPTMIEPVKELTVLCHKHNILSYVDGAHAPGIVDINVEDINCDYYTGNLHKWCFAPKGVAFMWVSKRCQQGNNPQPTVISSTGNHDYVGRFAYTGTKDYTGFCTIPGCFEFINNHGGYKEISKYIHNIVTTAGKKLAESWNTGLLVPEQMCSSMINVILPSKNENAVKNMQELLSNTHSIYVVYGKVLDNTGNCIYFLRLSGAIYLDIDDLMKIEYLVPQLLSQHITV